MGKPPTEYDKLRAYWYEVLKQQGFDDIEADDENLKVWSSKFTRKKSLDTMQAKEEYYRMATNFLREYKFKSRLERIIWEYHTNAISVRDIAKLLNDAKVSELKKDAIWTIVNRLETLMKKRYL